MPSDPRGCRILQRLFLLMAAGTLIALLALVIFRTKAAFWVTMAAVVCGGPALALRNRLRSGPSRNREVARKDKSR